MKINLDILQKIQAITHLTRSQSAGFMFLILLQLRPGFPRSSTISHLQEEMPWREKGDPSFSDNAGFSQFNLIKKVSG